MEIYPYDQFWEQVLIDMDLQPVSTSQTLESNLISKLSIAQNEQSNLPSILVNFNQNIENI